MTNILEGSNTFGTNGVKWWIGQVADRSTWADAALLINDPDVGRKEDKGEVDVYYNRVKVRVVGYHETVPENDLPWAHILASPMLGSGYGAKLHSHYLEGGESVLGFWIDGTDEQKPVITGVFYNHRKAIDGAPLLKGNATLIPSTGNDLKESPTGGNAGKKIGTNELISSTKFSLNYPDSSSNGGSVITTDRQRTGEVDPVTGRSKAQSKGSETNEGKKGITTNRKVNESLLNVSTDRPSCKGDDGTSVIANSLNRFTSMMQNVEAYGDYYIDTATGLLIDLESEIDLVSKKMGGVITAMTGGIRGKIFSEMENKVNEFTNKLVPEELKQGFNEALKGVSDEIYCLFENLIGGVKNMVGKFLKALVGKMINAPLCAAEQFLGTLLNDVMGKITGAISPILGSLTAVLGGALGSINGMINSALAGVGLLTKLIQCDAFKCPSPSRFDNGIGPKQTERDNVNKIMDSVSGISDGITGRVGGALTGLVGNVTGIDFDGLPSVFQDRGDGTPGSIASLAGGCESNVLRCGPPKIEFFGGAGVGGVANAVVNEVGEIIGADILDRGLGYTPESVPYVTFTDSCGDGHGARGTAIIGDDGGIDAILMDSPGYGYMNRYGKVKTVYGTIESDATGELANTDTASVTGQISGVVVSNPGFGYNNTDTINVGNAVIKPIILGGRVLDVEIVSGGTGFTSIPDIEINSETGTGATIIPILKFTSVSEVSETLDPAGVISVVNCVGKPLTRTRLGK